eukprot:Partr_v1_DN25909_c1_g1_i1_m68682 putative THO complex
MAEKSANDKARALMQSYSMRELRGHHNFVRVVRWSPDGRKLASGSDDKTAFVWTIDLPTGIPRHNIILRGHTQSVGQLAWCPVDNDVLATISVDMSLRIWDTKTGTCTKVISTGGENINLCWSNDGQFIAVGDKRDRITIWNTAKWQVVVDHRFQVEINEITFDPTGRFFLLANGAGQVEIFNFPAFTRAHVLEGHTSYCYCFGNDPKGRYLAVGAADGGISIWDTQEWICQRVIGRCSYPVGTVGISNDGDLVAYGSRDVIIEIVHIDTGELIHQIKAAASVNSISWHPRKIMLAYAADEPLNDRNIREYRGRDEGNLWIFGPFSSSQSSSMGR